MTAAKSEATAEKRSSASVQSAVLALVSRTAVTGKTTCAVNLAAAAAQRGLRSLVVDLDRGGFATGWLLPPERRHPPTIREALLGAADIRETVRPSRVPLVDAIPALPTLTDVEQLWERTENWETMLRALIARLGSTHRLIVIDCPPGITHLLTGALMAASGFLMLAAPSHGAAAAVQEELATIAQAWDLCGSHAKLLGVLVNRLTGSLESKLALFADLQTRLGSAILPVPLLEDQALAECRAKEITVFEHGHTAGTAAKFNQLVEIILSRMGVEVPPLTEIRAQPEQRAASGEPEPLETQSASENTPVEESAPPLEPEIVQGPSAEDLERLERMQRAVEDIELETIEAKDITEFNPKADNPLPATPPKGGRLDPEAEREMCKMAAERLGMPCVSLDDIEVTPELIETIPAELMREHEVFPIGISNMGLRVAMANPFDETAQEALERATGKRVFLCIAVESEVKRLIRRHAGQ